MEFSPDDLHDMLMTARFESIKDAIGSMIALEVERSVRKAQEEVFLEVESELAKHKFSTDMSGWDIVPKLTATMELLRAKFVKEDNVTD